MHGGGVEEPKRGEPVFIFVAKIGDEEVARARAEAFKKAQQAAADLAKAAGAQVGSLRRLESQNNGSPDEAPGGYSPYHARQQHLLMLAGANAGPRPEAIGM